MTTHATEHRETDRPTGVPGGGDSRPVIARLDRLNKVYRKPGTQIEVHALRDVSLIFRQGDYVAIRGHSGSGKSTLLNVLGCLDRPTSGRYFLGGEDVSRLDDDQLSDIRSERLGFVFQNFNLIPQLNIVENLEVPLFYRGVAPRIRRERAKAMLERVGLAERMTHRPMELSGGQQQRVAIARSLMGDPLVILADEPTGNLDSATGELILALFDDLHAEGKTILMVTHEPDVAARCPRQVSLKDGRILTDILTASAEPNSSR
jgi:putative ABC transport system ATP-binding protein